MFSFGELCLSRSPHVVLVVLTQLLVGVGLSHTVVYSILIQAAAGYSANVYKCLCFSNLLKYNLQAINMHDL